MNMPMNSCEQSIEDPILLKILAYIRTSPTLQIAGEESGENLCDELLLNFTMKYRHHTLLIRLQREGPQMVYIATLKEVLDNSANFKKFKSLITSPKLLFHAGEETKKLPDGSEKTFAVARFDDDASFYQPEKTASHSSDGYETKVRSRFLASLVSLSYFLTELPPDFLA